MERSKCLENYSPGLECPFRADTLDKALEISKNLTNLSLSALRTAGDSPQIVPASSTRGVPADALAHGADVEEHLLRAWLKALRSL